MGQTIKEQHESESSSSLQQKKFILYIQAQIHRIYSVLMAEAAALSLAAIISKLLNL
jgi:predicted HicB family RNase H-like nuclease